MLRGFRLPHPESLWFFWEMVSVPLSSTARDLHAENERNVPHVLHLGAGHQLLLDGFEYCNVASDDHKILHIERL